jgi:integrase
MPQGHAPFAVFNRSANPLVRLVLSSPLHPLLSLNMHRARHTFATEPRRVAGIDAASHALGHADLNTTLGIYGHRDGTDLEVAMEAYAKWLEQNEPFVPPEDAA